jgi:hypothetical protein
MSDRAQLALIVIGPERRERLIDRAADGLSLQYGMTMVAANRYATELVTIADPATVLAVGQTWALPDGVTLPAAELLSTTAAATPHTVVGFTADGMVAVGDGTLHLGVHLFDTMWLTAWPDACALDEGPAPPRAALPPPEETDVEAEDEDEDEDEFDPRRLWTSVTRMRPDGLTIGEGLPLLSAHYRAVNWKKPEYTPSYGNLLDVPVYLAEHLADYRAGWLDFRDQFRVRNVVDWAGYFNGLGGCQGDLCAAAYLGRWLWQRVRADAVAEHGGDVGGYDVMIPWSPWMADVVLDAAPYADPEWEIPADHPLAQCDGQAALFQQVGEGR